MKSKDSDFQGFCLVFAREGLVYQIPLFDFAQRYMLQFSSSRVKHRLQIRRELNCAVVLQLHRLLLSSSFDGIHPAPMTPIPLNPLINRPIVNFSTCPL